MNYTFILLSGGIGKRMQNSIPKQYMLLAGKPMIMHVLEKIDEIDEIEKIIIVCTDDYRDEINLMIGQYGIRKAISYAKAGKSRQESVFSGLKEAETDNVIIHEAARPFVTTEDYRRLIEDSNENAITGIDIPFTVIKGGEYVEDLLTRSELINVQLPQKFNTKNLIEAHKQAEKDKNSFTEDASLLHYYYPEIPIHIVEGKDYNIKITNSMDMLTGEIVYDEIFRRRR